MTSSETIWYQPETFRETGMMEGIELFTLSPPVAVPIEPPKIDGFIEGTLLKARVRWNEENYMVISTTGGNAAVRTDVYLSSEFSIPTKVRLRGVMVGSERQPPAPAWEVSSLLPIADDIWIPAGNQHVELCTRPATQWISLIESQLVPAYSKLLEKDQSAHNALVTERLEFNPMGSTPFVPYTAALFAKVRVLGQAYETAFLVVHDRIDGLRHIDSYREQLKKFEERALTAPYCDRIESIRETLLTKDKHFHQSIGELALKIEMLKESLGTAGSLVENLRQFGDSKVTMEQSTNCDWRLRMLPTFVAAESPRRAAKQTPKIRI